jgi:hypothetical protein
MPTNRQETDFAKVMKDNVDEVKMSTTSLDSAIEWMQSQLDPDDVFTEKQLENWAESNGYTKD